MIREFRNQDLEAVKSLIEETINTSYSDYPEEFRKHLISDHHSKERILSDAMNGYTVVLELEGKIIGTGTLLGNEILGVFIHPSYQRKGFGKSIMHELEERALIKGANSLTLESLTLSKKFYDSLGYTTLREAHFSAGKEQNHTYYKMVKDLK